jgi:3-oxoacyl-[acyl-carrier-protein] synthase-3
VAAERAVRGGRIIGWGAALPDKTVTNADLELTLETSDEWIRERTGIHERRIGGTTSGLATEAGRAALASAGLTGADIDVVILATSTPDQHLPSSATVVERELGIAGGAFDLNAACSGFVYGLVTAFGLIATGLDRVLLVGAETMSSIIDWQDRNTAILFGDGAGAVVIEAVDGPGTLLGSDLGSDGTAHHLLFADMGGYLEMDGKEVFRRAVRAMVDSTTRSMERAGVTAEDIALAVPHQANVRIVDAACHRLGIPVDRTANVLDRTGNTSAASIPLAMDRMLEEGLAPHGGLALLIGFGAGMSWASAIVRWDSSHPATPPVPGASSTRTPDTDGEDRR